MKSLVSGHSYSSVRERLGDKLEEVRFDPWGKIAILYIAVFI